MLKRLTDWAKAHLRQLGRLRVIGRMVFLDLRVRASGHYGPAELVVLAARLLRPVLRAAYEETGWGYRLRLRAAVIDLRSHHFPY